MDSSGIADSSVSALLHQWSDGDERALHRLFPKIQDELRRNARYLMRGERASHTLQPTALVNEAFLRLLGQKAVLWTNRKHFFAVASMAMRRVLVDAARRRAANKRGGPDLKVTTVDEVAGIADASIDVDLLALDQALARLEAVDERQARIVEMRYFGGLSVIEVATLLEISRSTVEADWRMARAWLSRELSRGL